MNDPDLEKAFLKKFAGAVLTVPKKRRRIPGSVGSMVDPGDEPFHKVIRFKFRKKPLLRDIVTFLQEYYNSIGWKHDIHLFHSNIVIISGNVWPAKVSRYLSLAGIFEKDKQGK
jgi:signal peptidase I